MSLDLSDGLLYRESSRPEVYVIYGKAKFWIPSPDAFNKLGFNWSNVRIVPDGSLSNVSNIPVDGTLLREYSKPEVYFVSAGQRIWIPTTDAFNSMRLNLSLVRVVPDGSLKMPLITLQSASPTPPSLYFLPDTPKHYSLDVANNIKIQTAEYSVSIVELRGWLRIVAGGCNGCDPDWHYMLEIDPIWTDSQRIDLNQILKVGNIICEDMLGGIQGFSYSPYAKLSLPCIEVELNGWRPPNPQMPEKCPGDTPGSVSSTNYGFSKTPKPQDWIYTNVERCPDGYGAIWPFDPLNPIKSESPLPEGPHFQDDAPYVKVVGSLVTDEPHVNTDVIYTWLARQFNIVRSSDEETRAALVAWGGWNDGDERHPGRWSEVHPPDLISVLTPPDPKNREKIYGVAVIARNGLVDGDVQSFDGDIFPPSPRPPSSQLSVQELVDPTTTNYGTIIEGNQNKSGANITIFDDHAHIHVKVKGQGGWGAPGKFKALYRIKWVLPQPPAPHLVVKVQPYPIVFPARQTQVTLSITVNTQDSNSHAQISGRVIIDGKDVGSTNTPITYTFQQKRVRVFDPDLKKWIYEVTYPEGKVTASGYPDAQIDFGF